MRLSFTRYQNNYEKHIKTSAMKKLFTLLTILMCLFTGAHAQGAEGEISISTLSRSTMPNIISRSVPTAYMKSLCRSFRATSRYLTQIISPTRKMSIYMVQPTIRALALRLASQVSRQPGNNLSVQGGGIIYNAVVEFDPKNKTLKITAGSRDRKMPLSPQRCLFLSASSRMQKELW